MFRLISKEPFIDKTRIGVYGKVRRTHDGFTALWGCVSVWRVGHPRTKGLAVWIPTPTAQMSLGKHWILKCSLWARKPAVWQQRPIGRMSVCVNGSIRGFGKHFEIPLRCRKALFKRCINIWKAMCDPVVSLCPGIRRISGHFAPELGLPLPQMWDSCLPNHRFWALWY